MPHLVWWCLPRSACQKLGRFLVRVDVCSPRLTRTQGSWASWERRQTRYRTGTALMTAEWHV
jgi:hypothetical protein